MNAILAIALTKLDEELTNKNLIIEIVICGAYALHRKYWEQFRN